MYRAILLLCISLAMTANVAAQDLKVVQWPELQRRLEIKNDTLYLYNFFATWCVPCVQELPAFQQVAAQYAGRKMKVVFVSLDFYKSYKTTLVPFLKSHKIAQEVLLLNEHDYNSWIDKVSKDWDGDIPATLFVKGDKRTFMARNFNFNELEKTVISLNKN